MSTKACSKFSWSPWNIFLQDNPQEKYAVVILNRPINFNITKDTILNIWNKAQVRITVDGGTDCWLKWLESNNFDPALVTQPDLITGDMDSIQKSTFNFFQTQSTSNVICTEDQNQTDFTKALIELQKYCCHNNIKLEEVMVFSEISGRFDQLISNVNTLFKASSILGDCKVYMFCPDSLTWLLEEGEHVIDVPSVIKEKKEWCGLLPIGSASQVTTTGLKWNLDKSILEFGNLVSSSNTYEGDGPITVKTDSPIVWTMGLNGLFSNKTLHE